MYERTPGKYCGPNKQLCKNSPSPYSLESVAKLKSPPEGDHWVDGHNTFVDINKAQGYKHIQNFNKIQGIVECSPTGTYTTGQKGLHTPKSY